MNELREKEARVGSALDEARDAEVVSRQAREQANAALEGAGD